MFDPTGAGNLVGVFDAGGQPVANYAYGVGLVGQFSGADEFYFDFDALGSTTGLTDEAGGYVNQYAYLPFGETTVVSESVANPFRFVGQFGVLDRDNGLLDMRMRDYDPAVGQFAEHPGQKVLVICGTTGNDDVKVQSVASGTHIRVLHGPTNRGDFPVAQVHRIEAFGLAGNDSILLDAAIMIPARLFGDAGNDTLRGGASHDLLSGGEGNDSLDGNGGDDLLRGDGGNDELRGRDGHDIAVGGAGNDAIDGDAGRDLLIGGLNHDSLFGGDDDDLLIGGTTSHDSSDSALLAILAEWKSSNPFAKRVSNIRHGTGLTKGFRLKKGGSNATVFGDRAQDKLTGGSGRNWFFEFKSDDNDRCQDQDPGDEKD